MGSNPPGYFPMGELFDPTSLMRSFQMGQQAAEDKKRLTMQQLMLDMRQKELEQAAKAAQITQDLKEAELAAEQGALDLSKNFGDVIFDDQGQVAPPPSGAGAEDNTITLPSGQQIRIPGPAERAQASQMEELLKNTVSMQGITPDLQAAMGVAPGTEQIDARLLARTATPSERLPSGESRNEALTRQGDTQNQLQMERDLADKLLRQANLALDWEKHSVNVGKLNLEERKFVMEQEMSAIGQDPKLITDLVRQVANGSRKMSDIQDPAIKMKVLSQMAHDNIITPDASFLKDAQKMAEIGTHIDRFDDLTRRMRQAMNRGDKKEMAALEYSYRALRTAMATPVAKASGEQRITDEDVRRFTAVLGTSSLEEMALDLDRGTTVRTELRDHYSNLYRAHFANYEKLMGGRLLLGKTAEDYEGHGVPPVTPEGHVDIRMPGGPQALLKAQDGATFLGTDGKVRTLNPRLRAELEKRLGIGQ